MTSYLTKIASGKVVKLVISVMKIYEIRQCFATLHRELMFTHEIFLEDIICKPAHYDRETGRLVPDSCSYYDGSGKLVDYWESNSIVLW